MKHSAIFSASVAILISLLTGCASTGYDKAQATSGTLEKAAQNIRKGNGQIDAVLFALSSLVDSPAADLKPQFNKYRDAVDKLESLYSDVRKQVADMQANGANYFSSWDLELAKIQNEDIRSRSTDRKNMVAAHFERVRASYSQAKIDFAPFMTELKDIRTALATDLTSGGLVSIRPSVQNAQDDATPLRISLTRLEEDFKTLGVALSSSTPEN